MKTVFIYRSKAKLALFLALIFTLVLAAAACTETRVEDRYAGISVPAGGASPNAYYILGDEAAPITANINISVYANTSVKDITAAFFTNTSNNAGTATTIASTQVGVPTIPAGQNRDTTVTFTPPTDQLGTFYYFPGITQTYEQVSIEDGNEVGRQWVTSNFHAQPIIVEVLTQEEFERRGLEEQEQEQEQETLYAGDLYLTIVQQPQNIRYQQQSGYFDGLEILIDSSAWRNNTVYQWYSNTENSTTGGTAIANTNSPFHRPPTDTLGTTYYYCEVTVTDDVNTLSMTSRAASVTIEGPDADPTLQITGQPQSGSYEQHSNAANVSVNVNSNMPQGNITYQWYSNTENSATGGAAINGANSSIYRAPDGTVGTTYYYCVVNATNGEDTVTQTSDAAAITITPAVQLQFFIQQQPQGGSYTVGDQAPLSVSAYVSDGRALSYQWHTSIYSGIDGMNNSVAIQGANASTFSINTSNASNQYYYCTISDGYGNYRTSNLVNVVVADNTPPPPVSLNEIYVMGTRVTEANMGDVLGNGMVSYNRSTNTLTLTDALANLAYALNADTGSPYANAVIGANSSLNIHVVSFSDTYLTFDSSSVIAGESIINVAGNLTISGSYLTAELDGTRAPNGRAVVAGGSITIAGPGTYTCNGGSASARAFAAPGGVNVTYGTTPVDSGGAPLSGPLTDHSYVRITP